VSLIITVFLAMALFTPFLSVQGSLQEKRRDKGLHTGVRCTFTRLPMCAWPGR